MAEYTYKDIIIDPTSEEAKNAVGKKCFVSNIPISCLEHANENDYDFLTKLNSINLNLENPFNVKFNGVEHNFNSIIVNKEEPKPEYIPFQYGREFFNSYLSVESRLEKEDYFLSNHGIWLMDCENGDYFLVTEIWGDGVVLGSNQETTHWDDLLEDFIFLDGSPCGKLAGEGQ